MWPLRRPALDPALAPTLAPALVPKCRPSTLVCMSHTGGGVWPVWMPPDMAALHGYKAAYSAM